jgi:hypothetical protein
MNMNSLCKYQNSLGVPGVGFHKSRIFGLAAGDLIGTILIAFALSYFTKWSFIKVFVILMLLSILLHLLFCVKTSLILFLFGNSI